MLKKFIVQYCHAQVVGTDMAEACLANNADEAAHMFYGIAQEWAEQFGDDEEENQFDEECNFECWAEEYVPEKHDGLLCGPGPWKFK